MMRNIRFLFFLLVLLIGVCSFQALAADKKTAPQAHAGKQHARAVYACPKCEVASMKPGKCSMCGAKMTKVNAKFGYGCADCHVFSAKAGKCPKCKSAMTAAAETYACEDCKVSSTKPGKCAKCRKPLTKYDMKVS